MNTETESFLKSAEVVFQDDNASGQAEVAVEAIAAAAESQASAEIAVDTPAENIIPETGAVSAAIEEKPTVSNEPVNYWLELDAKSEGLVKDEITFKGIIEKAKNADALAIEKAEWEKNQFKPANDYVKALNDIIQSGGTQDQIDAFERLNKYGNLDELKPEEAKIAKMVLIDGYTESVARKIVNQEFDVSGLDESYEEDADKILITKERLRISAKADLQALNEYKKDLSLVQNPEKENAEQAKLAEIAQIASYNKAVEQETPNMVKHYPAKLNYEFKIGEETVKFEDSVDQEFISKELPALVNDFFKDSLDPVNTETLTQAYSYAHGEYLKANVGKMLERAYSKGAVEAAEKTVNRYENRSGLPRAEENTVIVSNQNAMDDFINKQMLGK
jgi:hypothetical protein